MKIKFHPCRDKHDLDQQISAITGSGGEVINHKINFKSKVVTIYYILPIWVSQKEFNLKMTGSNVFDNITK